MESNRSNGHGTLMKINDQQEFFGAAKKSARMIVIFTRNSNKYGKVMLEHMELLAQRHLEARFMWVDAENAPFLTDRLNIYMLPTIVCVKDNKVHKQHNGLDEIDGSGRYTSGMLEYLLHVDEMLDDRAHRTVRGAQLVPVVAQRVAKSKPERAVHRVLEDDHVVDFLVLKHVRALRVRRRQPEPGVELERIELGLLRRRPRRRSHRLRHLARPHRRRHASQLPHSWLAKSAPKASSLV